MTSRNDLLPFVAESYGEREVAPMGGAVRQAGALLVGIGVVVAVIGGGWWASSKPSTEYRFVDLEGTLATRTTPPDLTGPIAVTIIGGFLILCGVILLAARPAPVQSSVGLPPPHPLRPPTHLPPPPLSVTPGEYGNPLPPPTDHPHVD